MILAEDEAESVANERNFARFEARCKKSGQEDASNLDCKVDSRKSDIVRIMGLESAMGERLISQGLLLYPNTFEVTLRFWTGWKCGGFHKLKMSRRGGRVAFGSNAQQTLIIRRVYHTIL